MGDGALVEFASVVDAVQCAVAIQRGMAERDAELPKPQRIRFRIGVNLGDVIVEGDDIYGDGVNIAARLEALAEPGGIVISGTAFDHAGSKAGRRLSRTSGEQPVKNIARAGARLSGAARPGGGWFDRRRERTSDAPLALACPGGCGRAPRRRRRPPGLAAAVGGRGARSSQPADSGPPRDRRAAVQI